MMPALIMLVIPGLPSYNAVEVYYLKGVIGLPIVISFRDMWYIHIFFLEMGSLMTSLSSAWPIQISNFPEPWWGGIMGNVKTDLVVVQGNRNAQHYINLLNNNLLPFMQNFGPGLTLTWQRQTLYCPRNCKLSGTKTTWRLYLGRLYPRIWILSSTFGMSMVEELGPITR